MRFKEIVKKSAADVQMNTAMVLEDKISKGIKGEVFIKAYDYAQGGKLVFEHNHSNIIVNTSSLLIARLLKDSSEPQNGIAYLALGSGSEDWDAATLLDPPAPTTSQTRLLREFYRKAIDSSTFVHPQTGEPTSSITNIVDYCVTFGEGEAVGPIVELGLFGGDGTDEINSGTMFNWLTFPVVSKTSRMVINIIVRITT